MMPVKIKGGIKPDTMSATIGDLEFTIDRSEGNGPRSIDFALVGLGTCTYATVGHYMSRKGLPMEDFSVELQSERSDEFNLYDKISVMLNVSDQIPEEQKTIILNTAKTCRVHKTLEHKPEIKIHINS